MSVAIEPLPDALLPTRGVLDVRVTLRHFAIVTYAVEPDALARHLPSGITSEVFTLGNGERVAFVSAVPFLDVAFRLRAVPWPRFSFGQTNYRAYVRCGDTRVARFFGTSLASRFVTIPRVVWRMPWHHAQMRFDAVWDGERCERYALETRAAWGAAELRARGSTEPTGVLDGFTTAEETARVLTHPTDGYFRRSDGRTARYSIAHAPLQMQRAIDVHARFEAFETLGLITPGTAPHSVLLQRETDYAIYLPPRIVAP